MPVGSVSFWLMQVYFGRFKCFSGSFAMFSISSAWFSASLVIFRPVQFVFDQFGGVLLFIKKIYILLKEKGTIEPITLQASTI